MASKRLIIRHAIVSLSFVLLYLLLNRPEVIFISRIGFVAWYPAVGLVMALLLGVSPWYALLVFLAGNKDRPYIHCVRTQSVYDGYGSDRERLCH